MKQQMTGFLIWCFKFGTQRRRNNDFLCASSGHAASVSKLKIKKFETLDFLKAYLCELQLLFMLEFKYSQMNDLGAYTS